MGGTIADPAETFQELVPVRINSGERYERPRTPVANAPSE
jgi:hypothetical protein